MNAPAGYVRSSLTFSYEPGQVCPKCGGMMSWAPQPPQQRCEECHLIANVDTDECFEPHDSTLAAADYPEHYLIGQIQVILDSGRYPWNKSDADILARLRVVVGEYTEDREQREAARKAAR